MQRIVICASLSSLCDSELNSAELSSPERVLRPVVGAALRGGNGRLISQDQATKAVTPITFSPPVVEIVSNAMTSEIATFRARFQPPRGQLPMSLRVVSEARRGRHMQEQVCSRAFDTTT